MTNPLSSLGGLAGQFWSTLLGAVVGAAVSGLVSWRLQTSAARASREAEQALREERREVGEAERREQLAEKRRNDLSLAHSVTFKLIGMLTALVNAEETANDAKKLIGPEWTQNSWLMVVPIANDFPLESLDRLEQSFVASLKISGLTSKVVESIYLYNDFINIMQSYRRQRFEVLHRIATARIGKAIASPEPHPEELAAFEPLIIPVRQLAAALLARAPKERALVDVALSSLSAECERLFDSDYGSLSRARRSSQTPV